MFKFGTISTIQVFSINLVDPYKPVSSDRTALDRHAFSFAVAKSYNDLVILTGGEGKAAKITSIYNIVQDEWQEAPPLNYGRSEHASCCKGRRAFVFGGFKNDGSIETLLMGSD